MKFSFNQDVDTVFNALVDPERYVQRCQALGERATANATKSGSTTRLAVERIVRSELPGPLAKIASPENTFKSDITWNDSGAGAAKSGSYTASVLNSPIPITINATYTLKPVGAGCEYDIKIDVTAKHLLLGKIAQSFAQKEADAGMPKEIEELRKQLG